MTRFKLLLTMILTSISLLVMFSVAFGYNSTPSDFRKIYITGFNQWRIDCFHGDMSQKHFTITLTVMNINDFPDTITDSVTFNESLVNDKKTFDVVLSPTGNVSSTGYISAIENPNGTYQLTCVDIYVTTEGWDSIYKVDFNLDDQVHYVYKYTAFLTDWRIYLPSVMRYLFGGG